MLLRDILDLVRRFQNESKDIIGLSVEATLKHSVNNVTYVILAMVQNGGRKLHSKYVNCGTHGTNCHRCAGLCMIFGFAFAVNWIIQTKSFIRIMITYGLIQGLVNLSDSAFLNTAEYNHTDSATSSRFALPSTSYCHFIL